MKKQEAFFKDLLFFVLNSAIGLLLVAILPSSCSYIA